MRSFFNTKSKVKFEKKKKKFFFFIDDSIETYPRKVETQSKSTKGVCEHCLLQKSAALDGFHRSYDDFMESYFIHYFRFEV